MLYDSCRMCYECDIQFTVSSYWLRCRSCGRVLCAKCVQAPTAFAAEGKDRELLEFCKFCSKVVLMEVNENLELTTSSCLSFDFEQGSIDSKKSFLGGNLPRFLESHECSAAMSLINRLSSRSLCPSDCRSGGDDTTDKQISNFEAEHCQGASDEDVRSINTGSDFCNLKSITSSPLNSPSTKTCSPIAADYLYAEQGGITGFKGLSPSQKSNDAVSDSEDLERSKEYCETLALFRNSCTDVQKPLNFVQNGLIWCPPLPENEQDDTDNGIIQYDDEDEEVGGPHSLLLSKSFCDQTLIKNLSNHMKKENLTSVIYEHFRALVLQLLKGEGICKGNESSAGEWLDLVASLSWQAANFTKPDTSRGGSMDPCDYVKVKCMTSGSPCESTLIRGVVCTKNVKHKRMTSQYRKPKLLLLGGALEYQRVPNQLASIDTLLQQEIDYLKMMVAKIETHQPNVLLVEKSVSSHAQEYLLAKEISLVLNVKKPLLERIARCTGGQIAPSIDSLASTRLGHCEVFRIERVIEECLSFNGSSKKSTKTLMFFEGCPTRLGCTVLLKGKPLEELKKVKHVVQYAIFAAYHLSLETSFLADEGASIPGASPKSSISDPEWQKNGATAVSAISKFPVSACCQTTADDSQAACLLDKAVSRNSLCPSDNSNHVAGAQAAYSELEGCESTDEEFNGPSVNLIQDIDDMQDPFLLASVGDEAEGLPVLEKCGEVAIKSENYCRSMPCCMIKCDNVSNEYFQGTDNNKSIVVSASSHCVLRGTLCQRAHFFRIKFYGSFDKPLGRFLRDDLFDKGSCCCFCNEPAEAHVKCYTHQQGSLTIYIRNLPSVTLPGQRDGKIWMWHRCLKCVPKDGIPPASKRVVMSDAAWGLSFGKFLELSFSNHATANRVASCGHSLQKDCLRYYGLGSTVAFFHYVPIDIFSIRLPSPALEFSIHKRDWIHSEAKEVLMNMEFMYEEVLDILQGIEEKIALKGFGFAKANLFNSYFVKFRDSLRKERDEYAAMLHFASPEGSEDPRGADILVINRLRYCLHIDSLMWDRRLALLVSLLESPSPITENDLFLSNNNMFIKHKNSKSAGCLMDGSTACACGEDSWLPSIERPVATFFQRTNDVSLNISEVSSVEQEEKCHGCKDHFEDKISKNLLPALSNLSDKIDSAWTGSSEGQIDVTEANSFISENHLDNLHHRQVSLPVRVHSFDSALRSHERSGAALSHLLSVRSFNSQTDFRDPLQDSVSNRVQMYTETLPLVTQSLNFKFGSTPTFISLTSRMLSEGGRLFLPVTSTNNVIIVVYDNEPTSIIAHAICSKSYINFVEDHECWLDREYNGLSSSTWQSSSSLDSDDIQSKCYISYGLDDSSVSGRIQVPANAPGTPHVKVSFEDDSSVPAGKVKFSVTCYFAKQFDALRKKCCRNGMDFIRSLTRCKRWSAQGGKSNVYFAKTLDERFIIKQVTKTELDSFEEFAPKYFKYLMDSLSSGSPTCLAKVFGIYQVTMKHLKGGKESKMELMVMENLFFGRSISRVYDLKGSARSRYNSDTTGNNNVLLDLNLLETLRTNPMFLGSKAKRHLERAVWNDTSFLASVDVMDYSLLVGVDEEHKELAVGIIDFMRQYTWDKHLETWVKASGILGGPKNASPTVISPKQYKKRFRKAMTTYFLTVPDQWPS